MNISLDQLQRGVTLFIEQELAPKASGFKKFALYFAMPVVSSKIATLAQQASQLYPDLFVDDPPGANFIKLDTLYNHAKTAIAHTGSFEYMGIIFTEADVDTLYSCVKRA